MKAAAWAEKLDGKGLRRCARCPHRDGNTCRHPYTLEETNGRGESLRWIKDQWDCNLYRHDPTNYFLGGGR